MISKFERTVAWRYLRSKKAEGFVSVIAGFSFAGIMLGVATLIIVMSVMNGFRHELFSRILGMGGHMNAYSQVGELYDYMPLSKAIKSVPGVASVTPVIEGQTLLSFHSSASGVMVRGISQADFIARDILYNGIRQGSIEDFRGFKIAIGNVLAKRLHINIGDKITLTSPKLKSTPFGTVPTQRSFEIAMIFDVEMYEYNNGFVFMPLPAAQKFFQFKDSVSAIEIFLSEPEKIDTIRHAVEIEINGRAGIYDWRDMNKSFFNALEVERNVMFLILSMIIIVAAFNIISSMIMLVKDKGHDIAIMRTMGATRGNMMRIFMLTGASIGFIGTILGAILGVSFALNIETIRKVIEGFTGTVLWDEEIRFLSEIPAELDWNEVSTVVVMAFSLSIIATIYPAWRAARLDPVEALRYE
ncbi:MAG: lipoprotein-releasing system transmembrane subunit LolC [Alphaproteobacteria bacterium]|nr:MAG: lipoprotein-releasing system transmembrane subunit LolC [Alphaproteobacteria bacterium]